MDFSCEGSYYKFHSRGEKPTVKVNVYHIWCVCIFHPLLHQCAFTVQNDCPHLLTSCYKSLCRHPYGSLLPCFFSQHLERVEFEFLRSYFQKLTDSCQSQHCFVPVVFIKVYELTFLNVFELLFIGPFFVVDLLTMASNFLNNFLVGLKGA